MADTAHPMLLRLAGKTYIDFYPYELFLEEGISRVHKAELTVLTKEPHTQEELLSILDKSASLTVSQSLGTVSRSRYLHGIVTGIKSMGVFSNGKQNDCYSHILTIEGEFARLRFNRAAAPYYRLTPPEAIQKVLEKNKLNADCKTYMNSNTRYSKNLLFEQREISDLEFIRELLFLYGISYVYRHPVPPSGSVGQAELYFSEGSRYPVSTAEYSDRRAIPAILQFDFLSGQAADTIGNMSAWSMTGRIGTDGVELSAAYPDANHGSPDWHQGETGAGKRYVSYIRHFHGYERSTPASEIDKDVSLILEARSQTLERAKSSWTGAAESILLQPGSVFELSRFYGKSSAVKIKGLVTVSRLHSRTVWPQDMAMPPEAGAGEMLETEFDAVNFGGGNENRFCSDPAEGGR